MFSSAFIRCLTLGLEVFSNIFFWYMFAMTGWWFIFYKLQERVYVFMPGLDSFEENYKPYDGMLIALTVCKFVAMLYKIIFEQSSNDVFVIDWETPKMYKHQRYTPKQAVSPWRRLFVVNEFNELQAGRHFSTEQILLVFLVISEGLGYKYYS